MDYSDRMTRHKRLMLAGFLCPPVWWYAALDGRDMDDPRKPLSRCGQSRELKTFFFLVEVNVLFRFRCQAFAAVSLTAAVSVAILAIITRID